MGKLSSKVRSITDAHGSKGIVHWCPGCDQAHAIWLSRGGDARGPIWEWDGNAEAPTTSPSIRIFDPTREGTPEATRCHYFLRNGQIEFCGDGTHALSGKTVPLPDWPFELGEYGGIDEEKQ